MAGSARELVRSLIAFVETRSRLAANELEEQALRLAEVGVWAAGALFFAAVGLVFLSLLLVLLAGDANRLLVAALLTAVYAGLGAAAVLVARARWRERPKLFAATLEELRKDRERVARDDAGAAPR